MNKELKRADKVAPGDYIKVAGVLFEVVGVEGYKDLDSIIIELQALGMPNLKPKPYFSVHRNFPIMTRHF